MHTCQETGTLKSAECWTCRHEVSWSWRERNKVLGDEEIIESMEDTLKLIERKGPKTETCNTYSNLNSVGPVYIIFLKELKKFLKH